MSDAHCKNVENQNCVLVKFAKMREHKGGQSSYCHSRPQQQEQELNTDEAGADPKMMGCKKLPAPFSISHELDFTVQSVNRCSLSTLISDR
jgi:hypothetical protein